MKIKKENNQNKEERKTDRQRRRKEEKKEKKSCLRQDLNSRPWTQNTEKNILNLATGLLPQAPVNAVENECIFHLHNDLQFSETCFSALRSIIKYLTERG